MGLNEAQNTIWRVKTLEILTRVGVVLQRPSFVVHHDVTVAWQVRAVEQVVDRCQSVRKRDVEEGWIDDGCHLTKVKTTLETKAPVMVMRDAVVYRTTTHSTLMLLSSSWLRN